MILLSGARQSGKTTLTKMLFPSFEYINFDDEEGRKTIKEKSWDRKRSVINFDEINKMPKWKQWLKGIYDTEGVRPPIIVTGSALLESLQN